MMIDYANRISAVPKDTSNHCKLLVYLHMKYDPDKLILFQGSNPLRESWLVDGMIEKLNTSHNVVASSYQNVGKQVVEKIDGALFGWTKWGLYNFMFSDYETLLHNTEASLDVDYGFQIPNTRILNTQLEEVFRLRKPLPFLNKRVVIVGSSNSLQGKGLGEIIDSYDVVIRTNWAHLIPEDTRSEERRVGKEC